MATAKKTTLTQKIRAYMEKRPNAKAKEVADKFETTPAYVYAIRASDKKKAVTGRFLMESSEYFKPHTEEDAPADNVNSPTHYNVGGIETIDFIEAKNLGYHLGNVVKYITRADHKGNRKEDLLKAQWYLNREIEKFTKE